MIESLEEETYSMIELLKQRLALHKPSPRAYLEVYRGIMQADRLFELEQRLKEALGVKEKTQERIEAVKLRYRKLPIRMSGDRYKPSKKKISTKQLELFT